MKDILKVKHIIDEMIIKMNISIIISQEYTYIEVSEILTLRKKYLVFFSPNLLNNSEKKFWNYKKRNSENEREIIM